MSSGKSGAATGNVAALHTTAKFVILSDRRESKDLRTEYLLKRGDSA